jgi:hypothetical protein
MSTTTRLVNAASMHPTFQLNIPESFISALKAEECEPSLLLRLPPAFFLDPDTFPFDQPSSSVRIDSLRYLNSTESPLALYDFNRVELEAGVGYSHPHAKDVPKDRSSDRTRPVRPKQNHVKKVGDNQFVVASAGDGGSRSRFQNTYADAHHPLAKEYRAVLFKLHKVDRRISATARAEVSYDDLTGERLGDASVEETATLDIPLHSRYVSPQISESTSDFWKSILSPSAGHYEEVLLDKPDMLWICPDVEYNLDSSVFDRILASDLLPSPHSHLSLQLAPAASKHNLWRYKIPSQDSPFRLRLPAGNASIGPFVQVVTFALLFIAAAWAALQIQAALSRTQKVEAQFAKKHSSKSQ